MHHLSHLSHVRLSRGLGRRSAHDTPDPLREACAPRTYRQGVQVFAGLTTLAVVGLWIAYLVPHKLRHRQQLLESRTDDRFSGALRVLAVTGPEGSARRMRVDAARAVRPDCVGAAESSVGLLTARRAEPTGVAGHDNGGSAVDRPHGTQDKISADAARRIAQLRSSHAATVARRGAAARRRGLLAGLLAVATISGWVAVSTVGAAMLVGLIPTVLLAAVLVLGRRAVVAGREADERWRHRLHDEETRAAALPARGRTATPGRAVRPSQTDTQVFARVTADTAAPTGQRAGGAAAERAGRRVPAEDWTPVQVPRPTYTMKASAPRREPAPLGEVEGSTAAARAAVVSTPSTSAATATPTEGASAGVPSAPAAAASAPVTGTDAGRTSAPAPLEPVAETTGALDLDAILARRRASGE